MTDRLEIAKLKVESALEQFERSKQNQLYRPDGTPRYTAEEYAERLQGLLKPVEQAVTEAVQVAEQSQREAQRSLDALMTPAVAQLSTVELERARAGASFVEEDMSRMSLTELAACVRAARDFPKPEKWLTLRYARKRAVALRQEAVKSKTLEHSFHQFQELDAELTELDRQLADPQQRHKAAQADELAKRAREMSLFVRTKFDEASGTARDRLEAKRRAGGYYM